MAEIFADLHVHSPYARATSKKMVPEYTSLYGRMKGLHLIGTGDCTFKKWMEELKKEFESGEGIYNYNGMKFIISGEISTIYKKSGKVRKIHHAVLVPDFDTAFQIIDVLGKRGNLEADGRPILGMDSAELVEILKNINRRVEIIPAHIWTPWFSLFGSNSGFDSVEECYGDMAKHIHALETGLSSDPEMNWRISALDKYTLVSNSDSHSPYPWRIGRECNVFDMGKITYDNIIHAIRNRKILYTIETDPAYGKYHWDGHRECGVSMPPEKAIKLNNICPVCKKPLTIGVEHRVEDLADRKSGYRPPSAIDFKKLLPLHEIISKVKKIGINTQKCWDIYNMFIKKFGNEFNVLLNVPISKIFEIDKEIGLIIKTMRKGELKVKPGYDGVYGEMIVEKERKITDFF